MWDTRMIGIPNKPEKAMVEVGFPDDWINWREPPFRQVEVGYPILIYSAIFEAKEIKRMNTDYLRHKEESASRIWPQGWRDQVKAIDEMLIAIKQEGYFCSWVIIEACTPD